MLFFFKQKTAYEVRISDWSSDVCSSDLVVGEVTGGERLGAERLEAIDHHGLGRLGRQALAPVSGGEPVAELEVPGLAVAQADGADGLVLALQGDGEAVLAALRPRGGVAGDPRGGRAFGVGVGNARGHARDLPADDAVFDGRGSEENTHQLHTPMR